MQKTYAKRVSKPRRTTPRNRRQRLPDDIVTDAQTRGYRRQERRIIRGEEARGIAEHQAATRARKRARRLVARLVAARAATRAQEPSA
jgi:hypothetical protein